MEALARPRDDWFRKVLKRRSVICSQWSFSALQCTCLTHDFPQFSRLESWATLTVDQSIQKMPLLYTFDKNRTTWNSPQAATTLKTLLMRARHQQFKVTGGAKWTQMRPNRRCCVKNTTCFYPPENSSSGTTHIVSAASCLFPRNRLPLVPFKCGLTHKLWTGILLVGLCGALNSLIRADTWQWSNAPFNSRDLKGAIPGHA